MPQRANGQALLVLQVRDLLRLAEAERVRAAVEEAGIEQAGDDPPRSTGP